MLKLVVRVFPGEVQARTLKRVAREPTSVGRQVHVVTLPQDLPGAVVINLKRTIFDNLAARNPHITPPAFLAYRAPASVIEIAQDLVRMFALVRTIIAARN